MNVSRRCPALRREGVLRNPAVRLTTLMTPMLTMKTPMQIAPLLATPGALMRQLRSANPRTKPTSKEWVRLCASRLGELRPEHDWALVTALAKSMWPDVGGFDPHIAAEMEHESWL